MYYFNPGLWYLGLFFTVWATREAFFYIEFLYWHIKQFSYVVFQLLSHVQLCNLMNCSTPGFPVLQHRWEFALTHVHWVSDAIQPSHTLLSLSPLALNLSQHQCLSNESALWLFASGAQILELKHQSFQWIFRVYFL